MKVNLMAAIIAFGRHPAFSRLVHLRITERFLSTCRDVMRRGSATGLTVFDLATILHGQIALLRRRCEHGLPVELGSLANTERMAHELKALAAEVPR